MNALDDLIRDVLDMEKKGTGVPFLLNSSFTLAKACEKMKEALEAYVKGTDFRGFKDLKGFRDYWEASQRYAEKTLADVEKMLEGK